jgi:hypothetical protein
MHFPKPLPELDMGKSSRTGWQGMSIKRNVEEGFQTCREWIWLFFVTLSWDLPTLLAFSP